MCALFSILWLMFKGLMTPLQKRLNYVFKSQKPVWKLFFFFQLLFHLFKYKCQHNTNTILLNEKISFNSYHSACVGSALMVFFPFFRAVNRFGDISLQERINQKNFEMLETYYKILSEKVPLECKCEVALLL